MNRWMVMALCGAMAVGCGATNEGGVNPPVDSGVSGGSDTGTSGMTDRGTAATDQGTATTDRGTTTTDRGTTTRDTGVSSEFGACGQSLREALCACGNDATCQQTAQMNAINRAGACQTCYTNAQTACCPDEYQAILTCAMAMGCADSACAQRMCPTQVSTFLTCFMNGAQGVPACQAEVRRCFGADFPMLTCP